MELLDRLHTAEILYMWYTHQGVQGTWAGTSCCCRWGERLPFSAITASLDVMPMDAVPCVRLENRLISACSSRDP